MSPDLGHELLKIPEVISYDAIDFGIVDGIVKVDHPIAKPGHLNVGGEHFF